ncbi:SGNH/GDSL hydrolase family protein [Ruegeria faecimaris]|uniref:GDSL-like Lipase/Acylhydrolase family protein n=1 Tax=Ruegeria faecimaris TaxID=686389 RepID=A0A521B589_9RHOB|nr:GDSL-type esterase/lipase family protein [Ruegeria faecimaris]SMO42226.1 GDSL-like Lipase/Acylhydrolase family protein [Ruegeria faecimaris]
MRSKILNFLIIVMISATLLAGVELGIRWLSPQGVLTTYPEGGPLGLKDPVVGHTNRPNTVVAINAPEFTVEYKVDENGFRETRFPANAADDGSTIKILLLGDSFTFGASNELGDIWPELLAQKFLDEGMSVQLINAGVPGYNTSQQALYLERLSEKYNPDIVLVTFLPNDMFANEPIRTVDGVDVAYSDVSSVVGSGNIKKSSLHSVTMLKRMLMANDQSYTKLYLMTPRRAFFTTPMSELFQAKVETTKQVFTRMATFTQSQGSELVVVSVPQLFQVLQAAKTSSDPEVDPGLPDRLMEGVVAEQGFQWHEALPYLTEEYSSTGKDLYFRYDGHLNADGNRVLSDFMFQILAPLIKTKAAG